MINKIRKGLIFGAVLTGIVGLLQLLVHFLCKDNIGCLGFNLLLLEPGLIITDLFKMNLTGFPLIVLNLFVFFVVGFLVGFLLGLLKKEEVVEESKPFVKKKTEDKPKK